MYFRYGLSKQKSAQLWVFNIRHAMSDSTEIYEMLNCILNNYLRQFDIYKKLRGMNNIRRDVVRVKRHSGAVGVIGG